jgi:hypothetical protein
MVADPSGNRTRSSAALDRTFRLYAMTGGQAIGRPPSEAPVAHEVGTRIYNHFRTTQQDITRWRREDMMHTPSRKILK